MNRHQRRKHRSTRVVPCPTCSASSCPTSRARWVGSPRPSVRRAATSTRSRSWSARSGRAVDDVFLTADHGVMPDSIVSACNALKDVHVLWISRYGAGSNLTRDLEVVEAMTSDPEIARDTLVDLLPATFVVDWAVRVRREGDSGKVLHGSPAAPDRGARRHPAGPPTSSAVSGSTYPSTSTTGSSPAARWGPTRWSSSRAAEAPRSSTPRSPGSATSPRWRSRSVRDRESRTPDRAVGRESGSSGCRPW